MKDLLSKLQAFIKTITKNEKFVLIGMFFFLILFFVIFTKNIWVSFVVSAAFFTFYYLFTKLKL